VAIHDCDAGGRGQLMVGLIMHAANFELTLCEVSLPR
jgi:hypothetical protein